MKITLPRQDLQMAVNKVKSVVASKTSLPILSHILFETGDASVKLTGTDLKISVECEVDCTVERPGACTLFAQRISLLLNELPEGDITLDAGDNNVVTVRCGRVETRLFSMTPDEFPPVRSFEGVEPMEIKQALLKKVFQKTSFAICTDQSRYNLTGLLFELKAGRLTVVATDGRRMSLAVADEDIPVERDIRVIIPAKMIHEMESLFASEGDAMVRVYLEESQAAFAMDRLTIVTSLIEGNFPNYEAVIPKKQDKEIIIDTALFTQSMRLALAMTSDKFRTVRVVAEDGLMRTIVKTPEVGEYEEEIAVDYDGEKIEIAFNPAFILEVLRYVETDKVCLLLKDTGSPGLLKPYTEAPLDTYVNVVMPIRI